ncbi:Protoporphyrinogen IX oxidase [Hyphomicrobiales bacterium]|nr:Protoporphyrinogen IX oxidase [Hyphomicrobiales bacterium]CAH1693026.1 Protoporphyrinogen IX oxidase [Hyphomicrobiales bacterium]
MIWLKMLHLATIAIWSAGLVSLPGLYVQRAHVPDDETKHRLQALVRFLYVGIISPAAFVAVGSGTALIFIRQSFEPWFSLKLGFVGALVMIHILTGLVLIRLFEAGNVYPVWRFVAVTLVTLMAIGAILIIVLAKPDVPDFLPDTVMEPGALRRIAEDLNPFRR